MKKTTNQKKIEEKNMRENLKNDLKKNKKNYHVVELIKQLN